MARLCKTDYQVIISKECQYSAKYINDMAVYFVQFDLDPHCQEKVCAL